MQVAGKYFDTHVLILQLDRYRNKLSPTDCCIYSDLLTYLLTMTVKNTDNTISRKVELYLIQSSHCRAGGRNHIVDEEEESIFRAEVNSLTDQKIKLTNGKIGWHKILLLIQFTNSCFWQLLHNHLQISRCKN